MAERARRAVLGLLGLAVAAPAAAMQVTVDYVVDLRAAAVQNTGFGDYISKIYEIPPSVRIGSGDAVDLKITFARGQWLRMTDLGQGNGSLMTAWLEQDVSIDPANTSIFGVVNASIDFLGAGGSVIRSVQVGSLASGEAHLGPEARDVLGPGESLQFSGYRAYFDVVSLQNDPSHDGGPWLYVNADRLQIGAVPEVSAAAMMLAGMGLVGIATRRRHRPTL